MAICIIMARDSCGFDRKMAVKIQRHICEYRISFRERLVGITLLMTGGEERKERFQFGNWVDGDAVPGGPGPLPVARLLQ